MKYTPKEVATATRKRNAKNMGRTYSETIYPVIDCLRDASIQEVEIALKSARRSTLLGDNGNPIRWRHLMEELVLLLKEKAASLKEGESIASQYHESSNQVKEVNQERYS